MTTTTTNAAASLARFIREQFLFEQRIAARNLSAASHVEVFGTGFGAPEQADHARGIAAVYRKRADVAIRRSRHYQARLDQLLADSAEEAAS